MAKKVEIPVEDTEVTKNEVVENIEVANNEVKTENQSAETRRSRNRDNQIDFFRRRAERQSQEIIKFLQSGRFNYEKTSFINKTHIIFQNLTQINDVNVVVGDSFIKNITKELNGIINLESNIRSKINSNQKSDEIKKAIEQLEETEKIKLDVFNKLKEIHQELEKSIAS